MQELQSIVLIKICGGFKFEINNEGVDCTLSEKEKKVYHNVVNKAKKLLDNLVNIGNLANGVINDGIRQVKESYLDKCPFKKT